MEESSREYHSPIFLTNCLIAMNMEQFLSVWAVLHGDIEQLTTYSYVNSGLDMTGYVSAWNSMA
jgi:hypothetical protein